MRRFVKASAFRVKCLALIKEVERTDGHLAITKNGKPIAELARHRKRKRNVFGILKGRIFITGDISPIDVEWNAPK
jgi:antitoxin (DNA-binding transcriptional repressor) of toxin-antitoxin stability system